MNERPPLGVTPRFVLDERRIDELQDAIVRYALARLPIQEDWIREYNELTKKRTDRT